MTPDDAAGGRTRTVRTTVDMPPDLHRQLKRWTADAAEHLDVVEVPLAEVVRVLVRRLGTDDVLQQQVLDDLRAGLT